MFNEITDHSDAAVDRLAGQFKNKEKIEGFLRSFTDQVQNFEDVLIQMRDLMTVSTATGAQLDLLGEIVGVTRGGRTDSNYRLAIRAKIAINVSKGTPDEIITIFALLTGATVVQIYEYFPGVVEIYGNVNFAYELLGDGAEAFAFDGGVDGLGFGDVFDSSVGGTFAYLEVHDVDALFEIMDSVLAGGVRLDAMGYFDTEGEGAFSFDGDPDGFGFGDFLDETIGGGFATIAIHS